MNQRGILSHVQKVFFIPQKSIRWIYVWTKLKCWFVLKHFTPLPFQFIHCVKMFLALSKCSLPSPATRQYVEHMERKASWVIFEIYSPSTLQSNTKKKTVKVDTSSFFYGESWHVELFLKFSPPSTLQSKRLNKCRKLTCGVIFAIYNLSSTPQNTKQYLYVPVIYEQSWHVESLFWSLNVLPPSPPIPFKTLRSTYQPIWNLESLLCFFPAVPYQNTTFNI